MDSESPCRPSAFNKEQMQVYLHIPDTMSEWPWPRAINPHHEEVTTESNSWLKTFKLFTTTSQYAFDKCDLGLLASLAYPDVSRGMPSLASQ